MKHTLLTIGEALIDFVPDKIGCAFDRVTAFSPKVGGAPLNVAGAFASLGGKASLLTALGEDEFGKKIEKELARYRVDTSHIRFTRKAKTALAFVSLAEDGNRSFSFYRHPSADMLYAPSDIDPSAFDDAFALHFCSVSLGDFPMKDAHIAAIAEATKQDALISFDPNLRFPLWESREALYRTVWDFLPHAHILKISDEELFFLTGEHTPKAALDKLFCGNVTLLLYTEGKNGAQVFLKRKDSAIVSFAAEGLFAHVKDTTGAGDGFVGAFLFCLMRLGVTPKTLSDTDERKLREALAFANRFAAASCEHYGALASYTAATTALTEQAPL